VSQEEEGEGELWLGEGGGSVVEGGFGEAGGGGDREIRKRKEDGAREGSI